MDDNDNPYAPPRSTSLLIASSGPRRLGMRLLLLVASLVGSAVGAVIGTAVGVTTDSDLLAWISAAAFPIIALALAGIRDCQTLVKIGGYALLGWGLCFLMEPTISQSAASHARRIASDPLAGKRIYLVCYVASWILVSVGVAFRPVNAANNAANPSGGAGRS